MPWRSPQRWVPCVECRRGGACLAMPGIVLTFSRATRSEIPATMKHPLLSSIFFLALSSSIAAQNCSDNTYPIKLVDAYGVPATTTPDPQYGFPVYQFANEDVYVAFDPNMPSGTYYVHVTDPVNGIADMVLSTNDPMDRFVQITNNGGGNITLSLPMSANSPVTGLGLGGVGQSLLLQPFTNSSVEPCHFKAWCGDWWDLSSGCLLYTSPSPRD